MGATRTRRYLARLANRLAKSMAEGRTVIALLDDDASVLEAMRLLLADWGYAPVAGVSAEEVLEAVNGEAGAIGAIVADFELGGGRTGVEQAGALLAAGAVCPVLIVSGGRGDRAGASAQAAGYGFLGKPVRPKAVEAWLRKALNSAG